MKLLCIIIFFFRLIQHKNLSQLFFNISVGFFIVVISGDHPHFFKNPGIKDKRCHHLHIYAPFLRGEKRGPWGAHTGLVSLLRIKREPFLPAHRGKTHLSLRESDTIPWSRWHSKPPFSGDFCQNYMPHFQLNANGNLSFDGENNPRVLCKCRG